MLARHQRRVRASSDPERPRGSRYLEVSRLGTWQHATNHLGGEQRARGEPVHPGSGQPREDRGPLAQRDREYVEAQLVDQVVSDQGLGEPEAPVGEDLAVELLLEC